MIAAEVTILLDDIKYVIETEEAIHLWLLSNVGALAEFRDHVDAARPWCVTSKWGKNIYHFARESDATLFKLRWS